MEFLIPKRIAPKRNDESGGEVTDPNNAPSPSLHYHGYDLVNNKRIYTGRPNADGSYLLYLMEGTHYEMSVDPEQSNISYYAKQFDLTTEKIPQKERVNVILKQPKAGDELST